MTDKPRMTEKELKKLHSLLKSYARQLQREKEGLGAQVCALVIGWVQEDIVDATPTGTVAEMIAGNRQKGALG